MKTKICKTCNGTGHIHKAVKNTGGVVNYGRGGKMNTGVPVNGSICKKCHGTGYKG